MNFAEEYDFVVVGGGPGGCVSASRLSEDPDVSVVLLEAGPDRRGFLGKSTLTGAAILTPRKNTSNWGFTSTPQPGLANRRDFHPHGRGLGGGSAINTLNYMRGHRTDYDEWAALGNTGWSYADVLPYFKKSENNQTIRDEYHGTEGPVWVEEVRTDNPYHAIVYQACEEAGLPHNSDLNGAEQEGFRSAQVMMKNGERFGTGRSYIHPHLDTRSNLTLKCETECMRILFEGKRAIGVEVVSKGQRYTLRARREVILSAGGLLSAKLLMLSGVGNTEELKSLGINATHHLPGVGENLSDHLDCIMGYHIPGDPNLLGISPTGGIAMVKAAKRWRQERRGMLTSPGAEITGCMRLSPQSPKPEIQYYFVIVLAFDHGQEMYCKHGMTAHAVLLHPKSRGSLKLASSDYRDDPIIDFNYLSDEADLQTLVEGSRRLDAVFDTPTMRSRVKRKLNTAGLQNESDWINMVRQQSGTVYHPVGTCKMGVAEDPMAVVDARLRVRGVEGVRVVDSSIMPSIVGGNTMAPTIMIAEKAADMIKDDWL